MIYVKIYLMIGLLISILYRLYDKEPCSLGAYFAIITTWPIFLLVLLSEIEI